MEKGKGKGMDDGDAEGKGVGKDRNPRIARTNFDTIHAVLGDRLRSVAIIIHFIL